MNKIKGIRTDCTDGEVTTVDLEYEIIEQNGGRVFQLIGGPTGYESFYIDDDFKNVLRMCERGWRACVGTEGRWDTLVIPVDEMKKVDWRIRNEC